jgi:hypothetical protein
VSHQKIPLRMRLRSARQMRSCRNLEHLPMPVDAGNHRTNICLARPWFLKRPVSQWRPRWEISVPCGRPRLALSLPQSVCARTYVRRIPWTGPSSLFIFTLRRGLVGCATVWAAARSGVQRQKRRNVIKYCGVDRRTRGLLDGGCLSRPLVGEMHDELMMPPPPPTHGWKVS